MMVIYGLLIAVSMYSAIPVPQVLWTRENMRYALAFFPVVGGIIGIAVYIWKMFAQSLGLSESIFAAIAVAIPIFITGGIHLDGFCDTLDARASHQDAEKRLEILKDSRVGAFALIGCSVYFLLAYSFWQEMYWSSFNGVYFIFVLSRAMSGFGAVTLKCAKKDGTLAEFSEVADREKTTVILCCTGMVCIGIMIGMNIVLGLAVTIGALCIFLYCKHIFYKEFGGLTGDLAGFFLQATELVIVMIIVFAERFMML